MEISPLMIVIMDRYETSKDLGIVFSKYCLPLVAYRGVLKQLSCIPKSFYFFLGTGICVIWDRLVVEMYACYNRDQSHMTSISIGL